MLAVDVDPIAVDATRANARRNGVARRIRVRQGSVPTGDGPFDLVLANLIASLLVALADGLVADLRPGGILLASGIFENREADVTAAFRARGLRVIDAAWKASGLPSSCGAVNDRSPDGALPGRHAIRHVDAMTGPFASDS